MTPKWQHIAEQALEKDIRSNVYQIASLDKSTGVLVPRVRSVIHREFLAPLDSARPLLVTTTDSRSHKVHETAENAYVEIVWWFSPTQEQLRISGMMHVLPAAGFKMHARDARLLSERDRADIEQAAQYAFEEFPRESLGPRGFDWEAYRVKQFNKLSGGTRAMWCRPVPGIPLKLIGGHETTKGWPTCISATDDPNAPDLEKRHIEDALNNFALVIIDPVEVDYVNLAETPNKRMKFTRGAHGNWKEEDLVP